MKIIFAVTITIASTIFVGPMQSGHAFVRQQDSPLPPQCLINRSEADVQAEIEHRKELTGNSKFPNLCRKFVKADPKDAISNRWRVAFSIAIGPKDLEQAVDGLSDHYGVKVVVKIKQGFSRGAWIECDEHTAERISELRTVRRVTQEARLQSRPAIVSPGEKPSKGRE